MKDQEEPLKIDLLVGKMTDRSKYAESELYESLGSFLDTLATKTVNNLEIRAEIQDVKWIGNQEKAEKCEMVASDSFLSGYSIDKGLLGLRSG